MMQSPNEKIRKTIQNIRRTALVLLTTCGELEQELETLCEEVENKENDE